MQETKSAGSVTERRLHGQYWSSKDGAIRLIARQCSHCGATFLPSIAACTECRGKDFRPRELSRFGRLYTYTIVRGSGGVWPAVYTVGYVDFPEEKVRVCTHLRETDPALLSPGMTVEAEEATLYTDASGAAVKCFRFHAVENRP